MLFPSFPWPVSLGAGYAKPFLLPDTEWETVWSELPYFSPVQGDRVVFSGEFPGFSLLSFLEYPA